MKRPNIQKFDPKKYAEFLDEREMRMLAKRKTEGSDWYKKRRRSAVLREIYNMACRHLGISRTELGQRILQLSNSRTRAIQRVSHGEIPRFEKWLFACDLAGIPRADAVVLYARESIPDHFSEYKKYVGSTLKRRKLGDMNWQKNPSAKKLEEAREVYAFLKEDVGLQYGCKPMPELAKDLKNLKR